VSVCQGVDVSHPKIQVHSSPERGIHTIITRFTTQAIQILKTNNLGLRTFLCALKRPSEHKAGILSFYRKFVLIRIAEC